VEVSREHGPFDSRWPCIRSSGLVRPATLRREELAEALDWDAFSRPPKLTLVPTEPDSAAAAIEPEVEETGARRLLAALAATNPRAAQGGLPADQT
jgi:hypothetical protein